MLPEYNFDYSKARPNRFADRTEEGKSGAIILDTDIVRVFNTSDSVNKALEANITGFKI